MALDLIGRARATQNTLDYFKGRELDWGHFDCVQMVVTHAANAGRKIKLPKYGDPQSAQRAMLTMGYHSLSEAMDDLFTRIDPARVLVGDFVETPGGQGFSALMVSVGNGRALGFHETIPHADILQPVLISGAWSLV